MDEDRVAAYKELKNEFDNWFFRLRELFPSTETVEEEDSIIEIVALARGVQNELLILLEA